MSVATYGQHAEQAADALNRLLRQDALPVDPEAVEQLLYCREAVIDALRQRLHGFGLDAHSRLSHPPAPPDGINLEGIDYKLATLLDQIAHATASLPREQRPRPTDVLGRKSPDLVTETWRTAAIESLTASHVLDLASDKPWLREAGAGWFLMRDLAVAMEAVLVLDDRLTQVGLLSQHDAPIFPMGLEEKRLVVSQAARVATWFATNDAPDHAALRPPRALRRKVVSPVTLVAAPEDLAPAQERLAAFLRPTVTSDPSYTGEPEITADSVRQLTSSQLHLCRRFSLMSRGNPELAALAAFFDARSEVLAALQPQLRHLVDVAPAETNMRRFWQQSELTASLTRMEDRGVDLTLQPLQLLALATATHQVTHNLGICARRELLRSVSNLRDANPRHEDEPVRIGRHSRLEATLTDLVNMPAPSVPVGTWAASLQRAALRHTLEVTPTYTQPPAPYPVLGARTITEPRR